MDFKEGDYVVCRVTENYSYPGRILQLLKDNFYNVLVSLREPNVDSKAPLVELVLNADELSPMDISNLL